MLVVTLPLGRTCREFDICKPFNMMVGISGPKWKKVGEMRKINKRFYQYFDKLINTLDNYDYRYWYQPDIT